MHAPDTQGLADESLFAGALPGHPRSVESGDFASLIAPLEARAGARLNGRGRATCSQAFQECPDGFRSCLDRAVVRATVNPLGLLIKMCQDGEHLTGDGALSELNGMTIHSASELIKKARDEGAPYPEEEACEGCEKPESPWRVQIPFKEHVEQLCLNCAKKALAEEEAADAENRAQANVLVRKVADSLPDIEAA